LASASPSHYARSLLHRRMLLAFDSDRKSTSTTSLQSQPFQTNKATAHYYCTNYSTNTNANAYRYPTSPVLASSPGGRQSHAGEERDRTRLGISARCSLWNSTLLCSTWFSNNTTSLKLHCHGLRRSFQTYRRQWPHARRQPWRLVPMPWVCSGKWDNRRRSGWARASLQGQSSFICCPCYRDHNRVCLRSVGCQSALR
jgi:hypothetical protein